MVVPFSGRPGNTPPVAAAEAEPLGRPSRRISEELLRRASAGDLEAREKLITDFTPFVLRVAARVAGRYLEPGIDDEISISLSAFNEAIDSFSPDRGSAFLAFSEMVIRRRLIDYYRKEGHQRELPLTAFEETDQDGHVVNTAEMQAGLRNFQAEHQQKELRDEIGVFAATLGQFGIRLADLAQASPRHDDAREKSRQVARMVAATPAWADYLRRKRELPLKEIEKAVSFSRKTLERQRKYIIALAIILMEDLPHLQEYIRR